MISLEKAKKLKEAGLKWEPKTGDWFYRKDGVIGIVIDVSGGGWWAVFPPDGKEVAFCIEEADGFVSARRLDQLLGEIYETYNFTLHSSGYIVLRKKGSGMVAEHFHSDTLENAAASALLWIYEGRAKA